MATPFLGQISIVAFNFAPKGWALCNGQTLPINQNEALFALLGTTYGGNGTSTFQLPNLQRRVPLHYGTLDSTPFALGQSAGEAAHTLITNEMPSHQHVSGSVNQAVSTIPDSNAFAAKPRRGLSRYSSGGGVAINDGAPEVGDSQPHENRQPFLTLNFVIALQGIFPSRN